MTPPTLYQCLQALSWRQLYLIARRHQLRCHTRTPREQLIDLLHHHLTAPAVLDAVWAALPAGARDGLAALLAAGAVLPAHTFFRSYGLIRAFPAATPLRQRLDAAQQPISITEHLWYLGLIHHLPARPHPGQAQTLNLPAEFLPALRALLQPQQETNLVLRARPGQPADLPWHLAVFLSTLISQPLRPLHGRWLPPRALQVLLARLGMVQPGPQQNLRSERRIPYLAFLHFVAEAAGLVAGGPRLQVTARGWQWLDEPATARWAAIWQAWLEAEQALAAPYRFPWSHLPAVARQLPLPVLRDLPVDAPQPIAGCVTQIHLRDERHLLASAVTEASDVAAELLTGPLHWLGVIDVWENPLGRDAALLGLTAHGAWLLDLSGAASSSPPSATQPCSLASGSPTTILVPPATAPVHLAKLAALAEWLPPEPGDLAQRLALTEASISAAVSRGLPLSQVLQTLQDALERPPGKSVQKLVRQWAKAARAVRLRQAIILETDTAALMGRLRRRKRIRSQLGQAISPTRCLVSARDLTHLQQQLHNQGYMVALPQTPEDTAAEREHVKPIELSVADAGLLWMAAIIYQRLGEHIPLPALLTAGLVEDLAGRLPALHQSAAELAADRVMDALQAALRGYLGMPAWPADKAQANPLPTIERALQAGQDLVLAYWSPGREQTLTRRVTPYWLEQQRNSRYLVAYCHLVGDERVFRLDRILDCQIVAPPDAASATTPPADQD